MGRASVRLHEELGRQPIDAELAAELETTASKVDRMKLASMRPVALDAQVDGDGSPSYAETIADEQAGSPYEKLAIKAGLTMLQGTP